MKSETIKTKKILNSILHPNLSAPQSFIQRKSHSLIPKVYSIMFPSLDHEKNLWENIVMWCYIFLLLLLCFSILMYSKHYSMYFFTILFSKFKDRIDTKQFFYWWRHKWSNICPITYSLKPFVVFASRPISKDKIFFCHVLV